MEMGQWRMQINANQRAIECIGKSDPINMNTLTELFDFMEEIIIYQDPDSIESFQIGIVYNFFHVIILAIKIQPVATGSIDEFASFDEL